MIHIRPHTDFILWIVKTQRILPTTAARSEQFLRRLIVLGADLHSANIEEELIKTVPCYENLTGQVRWEYRCALKRWQEYTREMTA